MEHLYFVLIGLGSLVGVSELVGFANTSPSLYARLPFKHQQSVPLPDTDEAVLQQDATGDTATGTWRYISSLRLLVFRRRFEMGRKPYSMGCFTFDSDGRATLRWSPFPLFSLPLLVLLGPALGYVLWTQTQAIPFAVVPTLLFVLVWAANWLLSRNHFLGTLLPEIEVAWAEHGRSMD